MWVAKANVLLKKRKRGRSECALRVVDVSVCDDDYFPVWKGGDAGLI